MGKKATRVAVKCRIQSVREMLLGGFPRAYILRIAAEKWGLSERQADEYIARATAEIEEANQATAERNLALITGSLWDLFRRHRSREPQCARLCLMDIAKLRGLDKAELTLHVVRPHKDASDDDVASAIGGA